MAANRASMISLQGLHELGDAVAYVEHDALSAIVAEERNESSFHKSSLNNRPPLVDASKIGSSREGGSCKSTGGGSVVVTMY